jgi:hypothetical protein
MLLCELLLRLGLDWQVFLNSSWSTFLTLSIGAGGWKFPNNYLHNSMFPGVLSTYDPMVRRAYNPCHSDVAWFSWISRDTYMFAALPRIPYPALNLPNSFQLLFFFL